jgi:hypothetical protein
MLRIPDIQRYLIRFGVSEWLLVILGGILLVFFRAVPLADRLLGIFDEFPPRLQSSLRGHRYGYAVRATHHHFVGRVVDVGGIFVNLTV